MKPSEIAGEGSSDTGSDADAAAIQASLERHTREALLRRLGPQMSPSTNCDRVIAVATAAEREKARGIGFGVDLVRAILAGRKTQTRRLIRPQPSTPPPPAACPAARVGELLYVREPWLRVTDAAAVRIVYAADGNHPTATRFRPAMYMPRSLARLWLRVTGVRVERLQSITAGDLAAEGLPPGQPLAAVWDGFYAGPGDRYADDPWVWVIEFVIDGSPDAHFVRG